MLQDALAADAKTGARKSASAKDPFADLGVKFVEVRAPACASKFAPLHVAAWYRRQWQA